MGLKEAAVFVILTNDERGGAQWKQRIDKEEGVPVLGTLVHGVYAKRKRRTRLAHGDDGGKDVAFWQPLNQHFLKYLVARPAQAQGLYIH